ncbi:GNAT family N-acetyltransferase [Maribacter sp. PR1]|uniref:GNAT family N-acetyltransferase n=1 Tax=Maribacter cobaltidurans TaxID=1178778 RepID=A0ABU7IVY1_9FLAO|nr:MULTISPECIES: GNAT family N-acetyltransferase [Maribacter]MDC6389764.1 GNAT family N-acetyltransferase [Maribacter sp. PR1]MEE1977154.1 GNAT family N-acetyltransferase [Maribacter cobaltidurans]
MIEVRKYLASDKDAWDTFIDCSKNSTFLFKRDFMDYHKHKFDDFSVVVFDQHKLIAALPAHSIDSQTIASHLGLSYGSLILQKDEKLQRILLIIFELLKFLRSLEIHKIIFQEFHQFYNTIPSDEVVYGLHLLKAELNLRQIVSVINLQDRISYTKNRRRNRNKALQLGIMVKEVSEFDEYWNEILIPNLKERYNAYPTHTLQEITQLHDSFPENIRQFNAYLNGKIIAGTTIFESRNVARVQYNSANQLGKQSGASDLLYSELIESVFKHKNYFDFGTSFDSDCMNFELLNWKETFGARAFSVDTYEIKTENYQLLMNYLPTESVMESL